jgi:hypothetical protein
LNPSSAAGLVDFPRSPSEPTLRQASATSMNARPTKSLGLCSVVAALLAATVLTTRGAIASLAPGFIQVPLDLRLRGVPIKSLVPALVP